MAEIENLIGADFVLHLQNKNPEEAHKTFHGFAFSLIEFVHKPFSWAEKHICLARLHAIFRHAEITLADCVLSMTCVSLALSLVATMKDIVVKVQAKTPDSLVCVSSPFICANGEKLEFTDGDNALCEIINTVHTHGSFNKGKATLADIAGAFSAMTNRPITVDQCYENKRQMRGRKGKTDVPAYNKEKNIPVRDYYLWQLHSSINNHLIDQDDAGDARKLKA